MLVRDFSAADIPAATALLNHFILHTAVHFGLAPQAEHETAAAWNDTRSAYPWLAAEADGRFAGFAKAGVWRTREAYRPTAEVTVYVVPSFHRRGVGRALYTELLRRLRAAGFHSAVGGIALPNDASVALHRAMGFRHVGTFREVGRKFERWHDTDWWQIMLADAPDAPQGPSPAAP